MNLSQRMLPGVLVRSGGLALLQSAAQCGVEKTKVKQQLQGSVLCHWENTLLDGGAEEKKQTREIQNGNGDPIAWH